MTIANFTIIQSKICSDQQRMKEKLIVKASMCQVVDRTIMGQGGQMSWSIYKAKDTPGARTVICSLKSSIPQQRWSEVTPHSTAFDRLHINAARLFSARSDVR